MDLFKSLAISAGLIVGLGVSSSWAQAPDHENYLVQAPDLGSLVLSFPYRPTLAGYTAGNCGELEGDTAKAICMMEGTIRNRYGILVENSKLISPRDNLTSLDESEYLDFLTKFIDVAEELDKAGKLNWKDIELPFVPTLVAFRPIEGITLEPIRPLLDREGYWVTTSHISQALQRLKAMGDKKKTPSPLLRSRATDLAIVSLLFDLGKQGIKVLAPEWTFHGADLMEKSGTSVILNYRIDLRDRLLIGLVRIQLAAISQTFKAGQTILLYDRAPTAVAAENVIPFQWESKSGGISEAVDLIDSLMESIDSGAVKMTSTRS